MNCPASASMCLVTPPGYVHEYGEISAIRLYEDLAGVKLRLERT